MYINLFAIVLSLYIPGWLLIIIQAQQGDSAIRHHQQRGGDEREEERAEDSRGGGSRGGRSGSGGNKLGVRAMPDPAIGSSSNNPVASPDTSFNSDR